MATWIYNIWIEQTLCNSNLCQWQYKNTCDNTFFWCSFWYAPDRNKKYCPGNPVPKTLVIDVSSMPGRVTHLLEWTIKSPIWHTDKLSALNPSGPSVPYGYYIPFNNNRNLFGTLWKNEHFFHFVRISLHVEIFCTASKNRPGFLRIRSASLTIDDDFCRHCAPPTLII